MRSGSGKPTPASSSRASTSGTSRCPKRSTKRAWNVDSSEDGGPSAMRWRNSIPRTARRVRRCRGSREASACACRPETGARATPQPAGRRARRRRAVARGLGPRSPRVDPVERVAGLDQTAADVSGCPVRGQLLREQVERLVSRDRNRQLRNEHLAVDQLLDVVLGVLARDAVRRHHGGELGGSGAVARPLDGDAKVLRLLDRRQLMRALAAVDPGLDEAELAGCPIEARVRAENALRT